MLYEVYSFISYSVPDTTISITLSSCFEAKEWQNTDFVQMFRETLEKEKNVSYVKEGQTGIQDHVLDLPVRQSG